MTARPRMSQHGRDPLARVLLGRRSLVGAVALSALLATTGCTIGTGAPEEEPAADEGGAPAGSDGGGDDGGGTVTDEDADAAGVDLTDLPEPLATAEVPAVVDGDPEATLVVSLHSLERSGETLVATYSMVVETTAEVEPSWLYDYLGGRRWAPYAIDPVNLNRHNVLTEHPSQSTVTDSQGAVFGPGQRLAAFAIFAAPPQDVTAMDVMLVEGAPFATGVEIG